MIDKQKAIALIQDSLDSLNRSGTIKNAIAVDGETVLMGSGADSGLDSLGFVTFIMDLEDRLMTAIGADCAIVLTDIQGFDINSPTLTAGILADHVVGLSAGA